MTIENGNINFTGMDTTFGKSVPVSCDIGYKRKGDPHITCLEDGSWRTSVSCEIVGKQFSYNSFSD